MEHLYNMQTCYADVQTETFQLFSIAMYITMLSQLKGMNKLLNQHNNRQTRLVLSHYNAVQIHWTH